MKSKYYDWLVTLTGLPTASGVEDQVIQWVQAFIKQRRSWTLSADRFGNLTIDRPRFRGNHPVYVTAHMDHPAFVVDHILEGRKLVAQFRGTVQDRYFEGAPVWLHHAGRPAKRGRVHRFVKTAADDKMLEIHFGRSITASPGDILTWDVGTGIMVGRRLKAAACDDLAGVAAAFATLDAVGPGCRTDLRLLLTRAEEMAFIGAIGACKAGTIPPGARLICLENSKSYAQSPIGAGPIVRVGDATSTFDADLTYRLSQVAKDLEKQDASFKWQRHLMPGGTCEASAFGAYGYRATCLCLPLGNYHNMNEKTGKIAAETISLDDFDGLVRLLVASIKQLKDPATEGGGLLPRLEDLFTRRKYLVEQSR